MAASWEKRNLGRRLQPESLDQNQAVVYSRASRLESSYHTSSDTPSKPEQQPQVSRETTQLNNRVNPSLKQYSFELHSQTYTD